LPELLAAICGIVVVAMVLAWRVRFRSRSYEPARAIFPEAEPAARLTASAPDSPLPPSVFLSAVEQALGQPVVSLRLRTPSNIFRLEPPQPRS
jgi:hypothetical protein